MHPPHRALVPFTRNGRMVPVARDQCVPKKGVTTRQLEKALA